MAGQSIYMETDAVRGMSTSFGDIGGRLGEVNKALETLSNLLNDTAFVGKVGGNAVAQYIDNMRPQLEEIVKKCEELNKDLESSAKAYEDGDATGSTRFH
ncbi:MAG: type VII secretion target [Candidatus Promineifilaceae bacterium]